ncbi:transposase family protein [Streptomyces sp. NPDC050388]|uniref:transposase family protein n=1 Tax=Streptomyces sp. NPDC050388 TaxID=3155781 RepID=UPI003416CFBF
MSRASRTVAVRRSGRDQSCSVGLRGPPVAITGEGGTYDSLAVVRSGSGDRSTSRGAGQVLPPVGEGAGTGVLVGEGAVGVAVAGAEELLLDGIVARPVEEGEVGVVDRVEPPVAVLQAPSRCWAGRCLTVCRGRGGLAAGPVFRPWWAAGAGDLVPDGEADGHLGSAVGAEAATKAAKLRLKTDDLAKSPSVTGASVCRRSAAVCLIKSPSRQHRALPPPAERPAVLSGPRRRRGARRPFVAVLLVAACAVTSGARPWTAIGQWARSAPQEIPVRLGARTAGALAVRVAPSLSTIRQVGAAREKSASRPSVPVTAALAASKDLTHFMSVTFTCQVFNSLDYNHQLPHSLLGPGRNAALRAVCATPRAPPHRAPHPGALA